MTQDDLLEGCTKTFMQLAGTGIREANRRAGRVDAPCLHDPPWGWSAGPANLALAARVRGGAGGGCNAGRRPAGPGQGGCARGSAASPGTRPAPYGSNAPHTRSPWALGPGSPALPHPVSGTRRRSWGRTSRRGRAGQSALSFPLAQDQQQVAGLLSDPRAIRVGSDSGEVDPAGIQLDEQQHIQPSQPHRVDGEEVAGHDASGLLAQERRPALARPPRRRVQPMAAERRSDRRGRDPHAKPEELALDALVAPPRFSAARRMMSCWTSWSSGGRPV